MSEPVASPERINLGIISIVCFNFASYVCNGLPLAVLPGYVLNGLHLSPVFAGLVIGLRVNWPTDGVPNAWCCTGSADWFSAGR